MNFIFNFNFPISTVIYIGHVSTMNDFLNSTKTLSLRQCILAGTQIATLISSYDYMPEGPIIYLRSVVY